MCLVFSSRNPGLSWNVLKMRYTDCEGSDALLVGAQGLGDGAHGSAVVSIRHVAQALLRLGELSQAVQPEVEVLGCHTGPQTLVQFTGEFMAALQIHNSGLHAFSINGTDTRRI